MTNEVAPMTTPRRTVCATIIWLLEKLQMLNTAGMAAWTVGLFTVQIILTVLNFVYNFPEMNPAFYIMITFLYVYIITVTTLCPLAVYNVKRTAGRGIYK